MKVERIQGITKKSKVKRQEQKDRRQNARLFLRKYRGGLSKNVISKYKEIHNG